MASSKILSRGPAARRLAAGVWVASLLAGCGGGGGGGGTTTPALTVTTYAVGGTVAGLPAGASLVLQDNGGDSASVNANTGFVFNTTLASGAAYAVTVLTQPAGATCSVVNGSGTVASANVTNVSVTCVSTATTGSTSISALAVGNARVALVPLNLSSSTTLGVAPVAIDGKTTFTGSATSVASSFPLTSCSTDSVNLTAVCINYQSSTVAILDLSKFATTLNVADIRESEFDTGAPSTTTSFSGVSCLLCGAVAVPGLKSFVVAAYDGYRVYAYPAAGAASPLTPAKTYAIPITENFVVSNVTNSLFSADYLPTTGAPSAGTRALRVVNLNTGKVYNWANSTDRCGASDPAACTTFAFQEVDAAAIADDTGVLTLNSEGGDAQLSIDLSQASFSDASGTFTAPYAYNATPSLSATATDMSGILASSVGHWGYTVAEFGDAYVGVQQLPATGGTAGRFTLADPTPIYLDLSTLTNHAPCAAALLGGFDPHAQGYTVNSAGTPLGLFVSNDSSCVAVINFALLYAAPRQAGAASSLVDTTHYDPVTAGAVTFFAGP